MPLAYATEAQLAIPDDAFNADDVAILLVTGGRYGGQWALNALVVRNGTPDETPVGRILTNPDERPDMAVDTALVWVNDACVTAGWKLATYKNLNDHYPPDQAPYFASATFIIDRR